MGWEVRDEAGEGIRWVGCRGDKVWQLLAGWLAVTASCRHSGWTEHGLSQKRYPINPYFPSPPPSSKSHIVPPPLPPTYTP